MNEKENLPEFDLEDIMKEFSGTDGVPEEGPSEEMAEELLTQEQTEEVRIYQPDAETAVMPENPESEEKVTEETIRLELPVREKAEVNMAQTIRLPNITKEAKEEAPVVGPEEPRVWQPRQQGPKIEPYSEDWEPEYEQPIADYVPPRQILIHPRSRLQELKRKLVAGPEKRYYELGEIGCGKLQTALFFSLVVVILSTCATALYALDMVGENRMKLMVFGQFLAMLISAALGSYQLMEGVADIFRGRFSLNSLLVFTFLACCADGIFCLQQLRVPCCAAFSLQMTMSLWSAYHRRTTEMKQMDTLRKAVRLNALVPEPDYYDGTTGVLRAEGRVEDFMDNYQTPSGPEKVICVYAVVALLISIGIGVAAGILHASVEFGIQVMAVSLLAAVPVTSFVTLSRPMCLLEKRLHRVGAVLCGWQGVRGLSKRLVFPLDHSDLFPAGTCKLNGVKFYGDRDPDQVVAYCAAVIGANGGGLAPLFEHLLSSRNGRHYTPHNMRAYGNGGIGAEVCTEPVLVGSLPFLKEMGVEIPDGISVNNAVYAAIDGELCGVFAVTYAKDRASAAALHMLCGYRSLQSVLTTGDFTLTEDFIRSRFGVNTRRIGFPDRAVRAQLAEEKASEEAVGLMLSTADGLLPYASAVAGARAVRTASVLGTVIHLMGGILGMAIMAILAVLGVGELLTPVNMLLYELIWLIPGLLITEWTRTI